MTIQDDRRRTLRRAAVARLHLVDALASIEALDPDLLEDARDDLRLRVLPQAIDLAEAIEDTARREWQEVAPGRVIRPPAGYMGDDPPKGSG